MKSNVLSLALSMVACLSMAEPVKDAFAITKVGEVKPAGWLKEWARGAADGYVGHMTNFDQEFVRAWTDGFCPTGKKLHWSEGTWSFEGGAYWFDGLVRLAFQLDDPSLKTLAKRRLDPVLDNMNATSIGFCWWLDRNNPQHLRDVKAADTWMVNWVAGMSARPISAWYDATGDERAVRALSQALGNGYWIREYPKRRTLPGGCYEAWRITGDKAIWNVLLEYGEMITANPSADDFAEPPFDGLEISLNLKRHQIDRMNLRPHRHGVLSNECLLSILAAYRATGNEKLLASVRAWYAFFDKHAKLPFGAIVMDEEWGHPGPARGAETCAIAAEMWSRINLMAALGEGSWGDDIEREFFNAAPATVGRDWKSHVYFQVPNRLKACHPERLSVSNTVGATLSSYQSKHYPLCCTAGLSRLVPEFIQSMWMKSADGGAVAALLGPSEFSTTLAGGRFSVKEETRYPFEEEVIFRIVEAPAGSMPLSIRIPKWCDKPELAVNGSKVTSKNAKGFACLVREWKAGDTIALRLPMKPRVDLLRDMDDSRKDFAYVSAGPLLFAKGFAEKNVNEPAESPVVPTVDVETVAKNASIVRSPMAANWNWPFDAPIAINTKDAVGAPLRLVPYGCTKFRASLMKTKE